MTFKACFCAAAVGLTLAASIFSAQTQQTGQTGTGTTTTGTTNTGSTGTNTNNPGNTGNNTSNSTLDRGSRGRINTNPDNQQLPPPRQQILTISGSVVLDDGTPPPMGAVIERECGGRRTREANVSLNGTFGFQIGGNISNNLLPDASDNGSVLPWESARSSSIGFPDGVMTHATSITGCELRAQLGGYRSSTLILTANQSMGIIDVGTIVLYPAARVQGTTVSLTSLAAPKDAQKALGRAEKAFQKKKLDEAEKDALAALHVYPVFAAAWFRLGQVYVQSDRVDEAKSAYVKAMEADANYVNPYIELARLAAVETKWEETARLTDRALELDPLDFPYGYYMNAVANYNLGHLDAAEKSARKLNQLDSLHRWPQIHLVMASILHRKRDYGGEAVQLRAYLKYAPESADANEVRSRLSTLEKGGIN
jgi:tetratricopeptide (TPR) repeat protein